MLGSRRVPVRAGTARSPGGSLYLAGSDPVGRAEVLGYSRAVALASLRMARRHRQLYGYVPRLLVPMVAVIAWGLSRVWVLTAGLLVVVLAVYVPTVLPRLLAWSGVRGRVLLYERTAGARASVTVRVRRRGAGRWGSRYLELWNLATVPTAGRTQPADRTARAGWRVMERAMVLARSAGLDLRLRSSTAALAAGFYVPLGFVYERPDRPGTKPRMVLRVPRPGVDAAGLVRLQVLVDRAADELQVPRPPVTVELDGDTPNARAVAAGRAGAWVAATPALTLAPASMQQWFAAHEVGHLRLGATQPLRTALTGRAALWLYLAVTVVLWVAGSVSAPALRAVGPLLLVVVLCGWLACSQAEEYAADRLAGQVLRAGGQDVLQLMRAVMDQPWFGPRGPGLMARLSTHPTVSRRLAAVEHGLSAQPAPVAAPGLRDGNDVG